MTEEAVHVVLDDAQLEAPVDVGVLSRQSRGRTEVVRFAYSDAWLSEVPEAFPLDPELSLHPGDAFPAAGKSSFGVFRDTAPDRWGRVLMERREALEARRDGRRPARLGEWAFLLGVSDATRMGALRFRASDGSRFLDDRTLGVPPATRLREIEAAALAIDEPDSEERPEYETWLRLLLAPGTSLGGARPKATFSAPDETLWIAKFPGRQDRHDVGAWELFAHRLAERAHIQRPEARQMKLGADHHTFLVRRFDRDSGRRRLYASAMTLAAKDDGEPASYLDIAQAVQDHGDPLTIASDLAELYRRAVFNVIVGNRDDHLRNHGFLRGPGGWRLAPAFDVNPNPDKGEHALSLDESSAVPAVATVRSTRALYRLRETDADRIEGEVRGAFEDWRSVARDTGITRREVQRLDAVIDVER